MLESTSSRADPGIWLQHAHGMPGTPLTLTLTLTLTLGASLSLQNRGSRAASSWQDSSLSILTQDPTSTKWASSGTQKPLPLPWFAALEDWPCAEAAEVLSPGAASSQASGLPEAAR